MADLSARLAEMRMEMEADDYRASYWDERGHRPIYIDLWLRDREHKRLLIDQLTALLAVKQETPSKSDEEKAREVVRAACRDGMLTHRILAALAAVREEEREAAAKIAETTTSGPVYYVDNDDVPHARGVIGGDIIAKAIRARGEP